MTGCNSIYYTFDSPTRNEAPPSLVEVGGKALSLIESTQAGFPVPPGFCLTVSFFETWLETIQKTPQWKLFLQNATRQTCDAVKENCAKLALSPSQLQVLNEAWKQTFGDGSDVLVAVRSSSPEEDLVGTSFAGGYETTLGVNRQSLQSALITSFASAFDYRIVQYKTKVGIPIDSPKIAVIVQRQIASDVSGVAFSLNPSNNCFDETVISANFGLGESVVSGSVTPDTYTVSAVTNEIMCKNIADKKHAIWLDNSGGTRQEDNDDPSAQALTDDEILQVAKLVSKVEACREDTPVDIEWAFQDKTLYLMQSRPVTAYIPVFEEMKTARGEEKNLYVDVIVMTQGFSKPMSVLGLEIWFKFFEKVKPNLCFAKGRDGLVWDSHGREFMHLSNLMKCPGGRPIVEKSFALSDKCLGRAIDTLDLDEYTPSRAVPVWWRFLWTSLTQFIQLVPNMIYGLFSGKKALAGYQEYTQEVLDDCLNDEYLKELSFGDTIEEIMNRIERLVPMLGGLVAPYVSQWKIQKMFEGRKEAEDLIPALSMDMEGNPTSEMGHMMVELASYKEIQNTPTSKDFLNKLHDKAYSDEFMNAYTDYITKFGCRGIKEIDAATPRTYERQDELFDQLKQIDIEHNVITTVMERRQEAYDKLLDIATEMGKRDKFMYHADVIQKMGGYRESPKYIFVACTAFLRRRALKLGERFVKEGRLECADQVFYLTIEQMTAAEQGCNVELMPSVRANEEVYRKVESIKEWPTLIDSRGKIIRGIRKEQDDEEGCLLGDPISAGVVSGRAKILHEPYEKPLERGEILVTLFTEPSWTPIFINCAAVIMEVGGVMQHGAIIAREYGIPCVSGIHNATKLIQDGDLIEVNGSDGTVRFLDVNGAGVN